jgi:DinB family protein
MTEALSAGGAQAAVPRPRGSPARDVSVVVWLTSSVPICVAPGSSTLTSWDPLDLPWDEMPDTPGVPRDRDARPSLEAVLELRRDRMSTVRQVIAGLTGESLDGHTDPVEAPGWPRSRSYPVRECLLCILSEEWEHRLYAERDLDALRARGA